MAVTVVDALNCYSKLLLAMLRKEDRKQNGIVVKPINNRQHPDLLCEIIKILLLDI